MFFLSTVQSVLIFVVIAIGVISYIGRLVDAGGFFAGLFVGIGVVLTMSYFLFLPILFFHLTAGIFTKVKYSYKKQLESAQQKHGARNWKQVIANGIVAVVFSFLAFYFPQYSLIFYVGAMSAIAMKVGDTWSSELGILSKSPRLLLHPSKKVSPGTPGAVSGLGLLIAFLGCFITSLFVFLYLPPQVSLFPILIITLVAFLGTLFDSLLGYLLETKYKCTVCGKITTKPIHCGKPAQYYSGLKIFSNNSVNLCATLFSAVLASGIMMLLIYFNIVFFLI